MIRSRRRSLLGTRVAALFLSGSISGGLSLQVTRPAEGNNLIGNRTHTVEWSGTDAGLFHIDLYYCGSSCSDAYCGDFVTALCSNEPEGCPDGAGDHDVAFPEPLSGVTSDGYVVRVEDAGNPDDADCSDSFRLIASSDAPQEGDADGPFIQVLLPVEEDEVTAGEEYTLKFIYDDGLGSSHGRFSFNLYEWDASDGDWSCGSGTPLVDLCEKPDIGCRDTSGDHDVTIPSDVETGTYVIEVAVFETGSPANCSEPFTINGKLAAAARSTSAPIALTPASTPVDSSSGTIPETTPSPTAIAFGADSCSDLDVNAVPGHSGDYTGMYSWLGESGGKPRFVRGDNQAVLQYAMFGTEGYWLFSGLGTTFTVLSDADHPTDISCDGSDVCWEEETPTGKVDASVEISCVSTSAASHDAGDPVIVSTPSPTAGVDGLPTAGASSSPYCQAMSVESGNGAFSDYSGTFEELGVSGGRPRFVRDDNVAVLQSASFDGVEFWILSGLSTTVSVASDAEHPMDITCADESDCWKEDTPSGQVDADIDLSCAT